MISFVYGILPLCNSSSGGKNTTARRKEIRHFIRFIGLPTKNYSFLLTIYQKEHDMNRFLKGGLLFAMLTAAAAPAMADYEAGRTAYAKGDYATALREFSAASAQGMVKAENGLGVMYERGLGVAPDYGRAMAWYRKAADSGFAPAQTSVGYLYAQGLGVQKDYAQAMAWYRKAADQGFAQAQNNIGAMY